MTEQMGRWVAGHPLGVAVGLLRADLPAQVTGAPEAWPRWALLLPHVLAVTGFLGHAGDLRHGQETAAAGAWLLDRAGTYLQVRARLPEARPLLERALAIAEAVHGPDHPEVAIRLNNLALILGGLGESAAARPLLERALAITETVYGPGHAAVASRLSNLATILGDLGEVAAGRPLLERALAINEAVHGPDHPEVATALSNLATILGDLGEAVAARPLLERALAINRAARAPDRAAAGRRSGDGT
jgi:tetratricopeptide (TPR) repeat protein